MSILAFLIACGAGSLVGFADRPGGRVGRAFGLAGLLVAFLAALWIGPATHLAVGDVTLQGSQYAGLFLACVAGAGLLVGAVGLAAGRSNELAPAALATFAGLAVAVTASDPGVALAAAAAAVTTGAVLMLRFDPATPATPATSAASAASASDGRLAESRTIGLVAISLLVAVVAIARPSWNGTDDPVVALAFLGLGLALAVRSGAVPFHVPAVRLGRNAVPFAPALLLVWMPAGLGLLAISWSAVAFGRGSDWLSDGTALIQIVAVATLVLGGLAALVHDEVEEVAAYSIAADAGFVLLALAARTDAAAQPARLWLLVFVAAKSGLVAWAFAVTRAFGTSSLPVLHGWLRRAPVLGLGLVVVAAATLGWPDSAVWGARSTIIRLALPGQLYFLFAGSILLSLACYGRLLAIGLLSPTATVRAARSERPRLTPRPQAGAAVAPMAEASGPLATGPESDVAAAGSGSETVASRSGAPEPATAATSAGSTVRDPESTATQPPPRGPSLVGRLSVAARLNRTLEVSLVLLAGAALAAGLAFGKLGAADASQYGIPMDTAARTTPTATVRPTPVTTSTPLPTPGPKATPGPTVSLGPSGSAGPSTSPTPIKTSAPGRPNSG
jgi:NADH-quinone oxidoreductase subunit N